MEEKTTEPAAAVRIETEPSLRPDALVHVPLRRIDPGPLAGWGYDASIWDAPGRLTLLVLASQLFADQQQRLRFVQSVISRGRAADALELRRADGSVVPVIGEGALVPEGAAFVLQLTFTPRAEDDTSALADLEASRPQAGSGETAEEPTPRPPIEVHRSVGPPPTERPRRSTGPDPRPPRGMPRAPTGDLLARLSEALALPEVGRTADRVARFLEWVVPRPSPLLVAGAEDSGAAVLVEIVHQQRSGAPLIRIDCELEAGPSAIATLDRLFPPGGTAPGNRVQAGGVLVRRLDEGTEDLKRHVVDMASALGHHQLEGPFLYVTSSPGAGVVRSLADDALADVFTIPPLRERLQDVIPAISRLLRRPRPGGRLFQTIHPEAAQILQAYDWPGGVAELREVAKSARMISGGAELRPEDLPPVFLSRAGERRSIGSTPVLRRLPASIHGRRGRPEKRLTAEQIREALDASGGSRTAAAARLGVSRTTLWRKIAEIGERLFEVPTPSGSREAGEGSPKAPADGEEETPSR